MELPFKIVSQETAENQLNKLKAVYMLFFFIAFLKKKSLFFCSICDICQIFSDQLLLKSFTTNVSQLKHNQMTIKWFMCNVTPFNSTMLRCV